MCSLNDEGPAVHEGAYALANRTEKESEDLDSVL